MRATKLKTLAWMFVLLVSIISSYASVSCNGDLLFNASSPNPNEGDTFKIYLWYTGDMGIYQLSNYANATLIPGGLTSISALNDGTLTGTKEEWNINATQAGSYSVNTTVYYKNGTSLDCTGLSITVQPPMPLPYFNITMPDLSDNLLVGQSYNANILFENSGNGNGTIIGTISSSKLNFTDNTFAISLKNKTSASKSFSFVPNALDAGNLTVSISGIKNSADDDLTNNLTLLSNFYSANSDVFNVSGVLCVENWQCDPWSACSSDGLQTRACADSNSCGTAQNKPALIQSCSYYNSGSSGGSGYIISSSKSFSWQSMSAGSTAVIQITDAKLSISKAEIEVLNALKNVMIQVKDVKTLPESISAPEGAVYQFIYFNLSNIQDSDINFAKIDFTVPKKWLSDNNMNEADIVLMRYHGGEWDEIPTRINSSDSANVYFKAITPGFSYFAIGKKAETAEENKVSGEKEAAGEKAAEESEDIDVIKGLGDGEIAKEVKETANETTAEKGKESPQETPKFNLYLAAAIIAILIIAVIISIIIGRND